MDAIPGGGVTRIGPISPDYSSRRCRRSRSRARILRRPYVCRSHRLSFLDGRRPTRRGAHGEAYPRPGACAAARLRLVRQPHAGRTELAAGALHAMARPTSACRRLRVSSVEKTLDPRGNTFHRSEVIQIHGSEVDGNPESPLLLADPDSNVQLVQRVWDPSIGL